MIIDGLRAHNSLCDCVGQAQITMTAEFVPFANKPKGIIVLEDVYKAKRERRRKQGREVMWPVPRGWTEYTQASGPAWRTNPAMDYDGGVNNGPKHGPKGAAGTMAEFIQLFYLFIPVIMLSHIATETNRYASNQWVRPVTYDGRKKPTYIPCARNHADRVWRFRRTRQTSGGPQEVPWVDVTADSLLVYFGILIAMGALRTRSPDHLWANESKGGKGYGGQVAWIRNSMTQQAFHDHRRFLHFENSEAIVSSKDPLKKVRRFITHLNKAFAANWTLGQFIVVDEAMIACKSRYCKFIQYMPAKPIKHGIKEFVLCCAYSSYVMSFEVYTGAGEEAVDGSPTAVIERLLATCDVHGSGHGRVMITDNWYTSIELMIYLWSLGMYLIGTHRLSKKVSRVVTDFPFHKLSNPALKAVHRGWMRRAVRTIKLRSAPVREMVAQALVWKDKKQVSVLSNYEVGPPDPDDKVQRRQRGQGQQTFQTHHVCKLYSQYMGGVDRSDRDTADWGIAMRAGGKWYLNIVYWGISKVIGNMWQICEYQAREAKTNGEEAQKNCKWSQYLQHHDGRYRWQMELAQALCRTGCEATCAGLDEGEKPPWMPSVLQPCECKTCGFCTSGKTNGVYFAVRQQSTAHAARSR